MGRAQVAAAGLGDRTETGGALRHHHADGAPPLALDALAVIGDVGASAIEKSVEHFQQLALVDRAAPQFEIDLDVVVDRRRFSKRINVFRPGVNSGDELVDTGKIAQCLDAAGGGASADGDQCLRLAADPVDALGVMGGGDRALDQGDVVGSLGGGAGGLQEVGDLDAAGERQQFVLAIQQRELAAVARGELPYRQLGFGHGLGGPGHVQNSLTAKISSMRS